MDPTAAVYTSLPHKVNATHTTSSTLAPSTPFIDAANYQFSNATLPLAGPVSLIAYQGGRSANTPLEPKVPPVAARITQPHKATSQLQVPVPKPRFSIQRNADSQLQIPVPKPRFSIHRNADSQLQMPVPKPRTSMCRKYTGQPQASYPEPSTSLSGRADTQPQARYGVSPSTDRRLPINQPHEPLDAPPPPLPRKRINQLHEPLDVPPPPLPPHSIYDLPPPPVPRTWDREVYLKPDAPYIHGRPRADSHRAYDIPPPPVRRFLDNQAESDSFDHLFDKPPPPPQLPPSKRRSQVSLSRSPNTNIYGSLQETSTPSFDLKSPTASSASFDFNFTSASSPSSIYDETGASSPGIDFHPTSTSTPKQPVLLHQDATSSSVPQNAAVQLMHDPYFSSERVFRLNTLNFTQFLSGNAATLVMFYNSKRPESRQYEPIVSQAACSTKRPNHAYAAVDCSTNLKLCMENQANNLPMARLYSRTSCVGELNTLNTLSADVLRQLVESAPFVDKSLFQSCGRVKPNC